MNYAFEQTQHDRAAHLRRDDKWRAEDVQVMVVGGEHIASHGGKGIRWMPMHEAPEGLLIFLGLRDGLGYAAVLVDHIPDELEPQSLRFIGPTIAPERRLARRSGRRPVPMAPDARLLRPLRRGDRRHQGGSFPDVPVVRHRTLPAHRSRRHHAHHRRRRRVLPGDRALLGRQPAWPAGYFSTLAGFVEPGESLIDAVRREVLEEVGIVVGDVAYLGSQPWPFPSSLMLGFHGVADTFDITVDGDELEEARWFSKQEITELTASGELMLPPSVSISRWLVEQWHQGDISGSWLRR